MQPRITAIHAHTGEILNQYTIVLVPRRPKTRTPFMMLNQEEIDNLAADRNLTGTDLRVLLSIISTLDFENFIRVSQTSIAKKLSLHKPDVSKSFKKLTTHGYLITGPKENGVHTIRLSPDVGWKGRIQNLNEYHRANLSALITTKETTE